MITFEKLKQGLITMGYNNLNKIIALLVISIAKGAIIVPRRSHPRIVRTCQWHITRRDHTVEKEFRIRG